MSYLFQNATAFDPYTGEGVPSATGQVYALSDTDFLSPLPVTMLSSGLQSTELVSDQYSQLPGFDAGDNLQVVFKSGEFTKILNTSTPLPGPVGPSAYGVAVENGYTGTEAEYNATLADAGNLVTRAETAEQAAIDASLLVGAPAGDAVLAAISEGGAARSELSAAIDEQAGGLLTEGLGIPSYAPAILAGAYDRRLNAYNLKPSNTRKWAAALSKARTGTGVARLNFYGDSLTMGGTLADSDQESFVPRVKQLLRASSGGLTTVTEGVAFTYGPAGAGTAGSRDSTDSRVAYPADAVAATAGGLFDYCVRLIPGTTGLTFTPNEPCDGFNVYFGIDTGNASFTVQIDSGATVAQDAAGTPQRVHMSTFSAGSLGNHVLKIGNVVAPGSVAILAVEATTGTTGIRVTRGGLSAQKWADLRSQKTTGYSSSQTQAKIGASLSVLMLGANDYLQQTPLVDVEAHARQNIVNALLLGDVMLAVSPPLSNILTIPWFSYAGILWKLADEYDLPLIDLTQRWGSHAAMSTFYNDNVHPKPEGHWDMAQAFTNAITSV